MRYFQLALAFFICVASGYGQTGTRTYYGITVEITKEKNPKKIHTKAEITPASSSGDSSWMPSLERELDRSIPVKIKARPGKYIVSVRFLIEKDGSMTDIVCLKDPGFGMCRQVMTAIKKKFPSHWSPGKAPQ